MRKGIGKPHSLYLPESDNGARRCGPDNGKLIEFRTDRLKNHTVRLSAGINEPHWWAGDMSTNENQREARYSVDSAVSEEPLKQRSATLPTIAGSPYAEATEGLAGLICQSLLEPDPTPTLGK